MLSHFTQSLRETFPSRSSEWALAVIILNWSIVLSVTPDLFNDRIGYHALLQVAGQETWALLCFIVGTGRLSVLAINGAWRRTPHLRAIGAFISCGFWFGLTLGFGQNVSWSTAMAVYPVLMMLDAYNVFRAITDAAMIDNAYAGARRRGDDS
ncbi:hypothetical protein [Pseudohoeflea coraliihabitans]|uniref:Uncharacterized protein n=1 Tax=Pseudohoeflea coraliihabitans TaxID=2860393 RepID=A0ABS6WTA9_9HYPH|nr:hypothetical protein [Pseudohoeflea sp. DP4N28-3]MBW3099202.1 hypothetical protein [Pseudohoeflea sp. DP4N28-3]